MKIFEHLILSQLIYITATFTRQRRHCDVILVLMLLQTVTEDVY